MLFILLVISLFIYPTVLYLAYLFDCEQYLRMLTLILLVAFLFLIIINYV